MSSRPVLESQQSSAFEAAGRVFPGCWKLAARHAMTLRAPSRSVLEMAHGRVWLTLAGPHAGRGNDQGDRFLSAGEWLVIEPGQSLVLEPFEPATGTSTDIDLNAENAGSVAFRWDVMPPAVVIQPSFAQALAELNTSLGQGGRAALGVVQASWRLVIGLLGQAGARWVGSGVLTHH
jgi:hypothetical protein